MAGSRRSTEPLVVKPTTAAELLQVSRAQVYNLMASGDLRRVKLGETRSVRIPIEDVYALIGREYPEVGRRFPGGDAA